MNNTKLSLADFKAKAGKAFINMESINGGRLSNCHIHPPVVMGPIIIKTDNA